MKNIILFNLALLLAFISFALIGFAVENVFERLSNGNAVNHLLKDDWWLLILGIFAIAMAYLGFRKSERILIAILALCLAGIVAGGIVYLAKSSGIASVGFIMPTIIVVALGLLLARNKMNNMINNSVVMAILVLFAINVNIESSPKSFISTKIEKISSDENKLFATEVTREISGQKIIETFDIVPGNSGPESDERYNVNGLSIVNHSRDWLWLHLVMRYSEITNGETKYKLLHKLYNTQLNETYHMGDWSAALENSNLMSQKYFDVDENGWPYITKTDNETKEKLFLHAYTGQRSIRSDKNSIKPEKDVSKIFISRRNQLISATETVKKRDKKLHSTINEYDDHSIKDVTILTHSKDWRWSCLQIHHERVLEEMDYRVHDVNFYRLYDSKLNVIVDLQDGYNQLCESSDLKNRDVFRDAPGAYLLYYKLIQGTPKLHRFYLDALARNQEFYDYKLNRMASKELAKHSKAPAVDDLKEPGVLKVKLK